jgi:hypothetical protein
LCTQKQRFGKIFYLFLKIRLCRFCYEKVKYFVKPFSLLNSRVYVYLLRSFTSRPFLWRGVLKRKTSYLSGDCSFGPSSPAQPPLITNVLADSLKHERSRRCRTLCGVATSPRYGRRPRRRLLSAEVRLKKVNVRVSLKWKKKRCCRR